MGIASLNAILQFCLRRLWERSFIQQSSAAFFGLACLYCLVQSGGRCRCPASPATPAKNYQWCAKTS